MKLHFWHDPGRGWLKVPRDLLIQLNILDQISRYSYQHGNFVYLEEDCDARKFMEAAKVAGLTVTMNRHYTKRPSWIRKYEGFKP